MAAIMLGGATETLKAMRDDGVFLDPQGGTGDDYACLVTSDPAIAKKLCPTNDSVENRGTNFTYGGKYNGRSYSFSGCVKVSAVLSKFSYRMTGKIGSVPMSGNTVGLSLKGTTLTLPFKGKVGNQVVTGTATLRDSANGPNAAASLVAHLKIGT